MAGVTGRPRGSLRHAVKDGNLLSPCATCHTRCCQEHIIPVNGYDLWRIARGLEYPPERFLQVVTEDEPSDHGFHLDRSPQTFSLALARSRSREETCVFWLALDEGATGRCGIYGLRPDVCRTYPAGIIDLQVVRRGDVLCPAGAWRDGSLQQARWRNDIFSLAVENDIYRLAVARWNRHVLQAPIANERVYDHYLDYLLNFYDHLSPVRESLDGTTWTNMCAWWGELLMQGSSPLDGGASIPLQWAEAVRGVMQET